MHLAFQPNAGCTFNQFSTTIIILYSIEHHHRQHQLINIYFKDFHIFERNFFSDRFEKRLPLWFNSDQVKMHIFMCTNRNVEQFFEMNEKKLFEKEYLKFIINFLDKCAFKIQTHSAPITF